MKNKAWAKTILEVYGYLETICGTIDDVVKNTSLDGFGISNDTKDSAERIIELTTKKKNLINLKILIENSLAKLSSADIKILTLFYIDSVKAKDLSEMMGISLRTFFRRKDIALINFIKEIKANGYDANKLCAIYKNEHWIINTYEKNLSVMLSKKENNFVYTIILKHAINEIKSYRKKKYNYY